MFRSYFNIALRNLRKHKLLAGINILGLATGIACCLLIALYIFHETSYDRFNKKADRIVRVTMEYAFDGVVNKISVTGNKVFPAFKRTFPEVESGVRALSADVILKIDEKIFEEKDFIYADSTLFDIFSFNLLRGDAHKVLDKPQQIVITTSAAKKYFGNQDPVGKTMLLNNQKEFVVTGVMQDCPVNSQIKFNVVASFSSLGDDYTYERWWDANYITYLLLKTPNSAKTLQSKIPAYMKTQDKENGLANGNYMTFHLEPLKDVHLYSSVQGGLEPGSDYHYIYIFGAIALLILTIAFANYVNLTTARAAERAREVGVRKVMGALRNQLFGQFMSESVLIVFMSMLLGISLGILFLPAFNALADRQLTFSTLMQPLPVITVLGVLLIIGFLGGMYPALVLSGFNPIKVLKGNFKTGTSGVWLRKSLIVIQFVISVGLIVSTLIIHGQLTFIQNKKLGYNKEHVMVLPLDKFIYDKIHTVKSALLSNPNIIAVTTVNQTPTFIPGKYNLTLKGRDMIVTAVRADKDFVKTMQLQLRSGTDFSITDEQLADSQNIQRPLLINEAAAKSLGWTPEQAVGQPISFQGRNSIIKGVVHDFHFSSLHDAISPFVIFISGYKRNVLVRVSGEQLPQTLQFMKQKWSVLAAHRPFEYEFLDDQYDKLYSSETRTGQLFYRFALLAIGLACLGVLGLATFTAQQRTKEIGIRKVLGASVTGIVALLSKDFVKLVVIASLIAFPLAGWAMHSWLQDFTYRINISIWVFILAGAFALLITLVTICIQVFRASIANPVKSLRTE